MVIVSPMETEPFDLTNEADETTDELIDQVMEWLGQKLRKSHIKIKLREIYGDIKIHVIERLITLAKKRIRQVYNVDIEEFKGSSIEFYCSVIRDETVPVKFKLVAQQQLDKLLGLEHVISEDPADYAEKIQQAMKEMDGTIPDAANEPLEQT